MDTWESVHAGDTVLGHDGQTYGVLSVEPGPVVTLVRYGVIVGPARPPAGTPITIIERADVSHEAQAFAVLQAAGLDPQVMGETWQ